MSRNDTPEAFRDLSGFQELDHAELTRTEGGVMIRQDPDGVWRTCTEPYPPLGGKGFPRFPGTGLPPRFPQF
jgi:hypothetical protein